MMGYDLKNGENQENPEIIQITVQTIE